MRDECQTSHAASCDDGLNKQCDCRIAEAVCGKIAKSVLKQRPNTVQRGSDILLTMIELGQAEAVVVRIPEPGMRLTRAAFGIDNSASFTRGLLFTTYRYYIMKLKQWQLLLMHFFCLCTGSAGIGSQR